jgi:cysteine desulfurase
VKRIYLDYNATTPLDESAFEAMSPYLKEKCGNPSSMHQFGQEAAAAVEEARKSLGLLIGASPREIFFTSGATESDNWAILGLAGANSHEGRHVVTSAVEHPAVGSACGFLEERGFSVTRVPVDRHGRVSPRAFEDAVRPDTVLATIMHANNEVGTVQPIAELAEIARAKGVAFHTDAAQSVGKIQVDVQSMGVQLLSLSAHKFYGPKGVGALYVKKGTRIDPLIMGGAQESGNRAGTLNVPGIVGLGQAAKVASARVESDGRAQASLRDWLQNEILQSVEGARVNGAGNRLPGTLSISLESVQGPDLMVALDLEGIAVSAGAACHSGAAEPSAVLMAMGVSKAAAIGSIRISLGRHTTKDDLETFLSALPRAIKRARGERVA